MGSGGYEILAGQDDESNDYLTFCLGNPNDIWMHVRGVSGSHVVLRCGDSKEKPDKTSLKEAARIAAWYSKMRSGGKVPVSYCLVRHVRKPKKVRAGTVQIQKANVIMVKPSLLDELE